MVVFRRPASQLVEAPAAQHDPLEQRPGGDLQIHSPTKPGRRQKQGQFGNSQVTGARGGPTAHLAQALGVQVGSLAGPDEEDSIGAALTVPIQQAQLTPAGPEIATGNSPGQHEAQRPVESFEVRAGPLG